MTRIMLTGCRSDPLGAYLTGLGAWRALVRLDADPDARAHWEGGYLVLTTKLAEQDLVAMFCGSFEPVPIVSPWNSGSGFAGNGKSRSAEEALETVRTSTDPRLARLRAVVLAADEVVREGRTRGWGGPKGEFWDKTHKADVITLCRNRLPDDALPWLDAAVVLAQADEPSYSRLLGTGGNFGRQDLSATYVARALTVLADPAHAKRVEPWLRAALFGDESVPYLREAVGQFDPGRAGGVQSSPLEDRDKDGFANPWALLFMLEGALLFASAAVRRQGALAAHAALPFQVRSSPVGFGSSASAEQALGEMWTPEWDRPAPLAEITHLLGEGRADWSGRPARTGLDFVRAVASLGVDRGITRFTRHVFVDRLGQNPLAVPVGHVRVQARADVGLLADLDQWLNTVRATNPPGGVAAWLRRVETELFGIAAGGGAEGFRAALVALGRLHEALARSGQLLDRTRPLVIRRSLDWWQTLRPDSAELRVAGALASNRDGPQGAGALRLLVSPVEPDGRRLVWTSRPPTVPAGARLVDTLAAVHRRRALPGTVEDPTERFEQPAPAVRGVFTAYRYGLVVPAADVVALAEDRLDEVLIGDYLRGLVLFDWTTAGPAALQQATARPGGTEPMLVPPALSVLLPFFSFDALQVRLTDDVPTPATVVLRPGADWLVSLQAAGPAHAVGDALRRLRAAGITETLNERAVVRTRLHGDRLAAALLLRVAPSARVAALRRVAPLPTPDPSTRSPV